MGKEHRKVSARYGTRRAGRRTGGLLTGGLLTAALVGLTGCSDGTDSTEADDKPTASSASTARPTPTPTAAQDTSAAQSSPEEAVAAWVTAVVKGDAEQACLLMAEAGTGSSPAVIGSAETCADDSAQGRQIKQSVGQFKESFTPDPPTADPKVEVTEATPTGDKATYPADKISIDGQTLADVIVSNSTGLKPDQLNVSVESSKLNDAWYVTNMDFDIG